MWNSLLNLMAHIVNLAQKIIWSGGYIVTLYYGPLKFYVT